MGYTHVGFTGTQVGMTVLQMTQVDRLLKLLLVWSGTPQVSRDLKFGWFHHGDCVGSDDNADALARRLEMCIVIHPPEDPKKRAWCKVREGIDLIMPKKPYLERNRDIVDSSEVLIATPKSGEEELRSGTWSTIRYARRFNKKLFIVYPDGGVSL